jgi:3D (Asp-Asp-Asp) domain-containing protein
MKIFENESIPFSLKKTIAMSTTLIIAIILSVKIFSYELSRNIHPAKVNETNIEQTIIPDNLENEEQIVKDEKIIDSNASQEDAVNQEEIKIEEKKDEPKNIVIEEKSEGPKEVKQTESAARNSTTSRGGYVVRTGGVPETYKEVKDMKATAYCLCTKCCGKSVNNPEYGVTRSGLKIVPNTGMKVIAVDPKVIPLGTWVYVEGVNGTPDYGYAIAADTGGAIKNNKIDLYMESHDATCSWGIKNVKVYIVE